MGMTKAEREFKIAELLEEAKEYERFEKFYASIPSISCRMRTEESHLPLLYITSADDNKGTSYGRTNCKP